MSSNPALSSATAKSTFPPPQTPSPSQTSNSSSFGAENNTQRRAGGSGSFGAGSTSRVPSAPRHCQTFRKQHKGQRRPRLADEDAAAESAAMQSSNSRKGRTSITHLMSFALPPRPPTCYNHQFGRNARRNPTWGLGSGYHAADKAKYVHANYRFIVDPNGDYRSQAIDADVHLDWSNVLQILVSEQSQSTNCPICLSTPVAPRMAKCGHIFCLPCLIRYMHSSDDVNPAPEKRPRWKKCPICWDSIYISETRPVRWFTGQEGQRPQEGEDVVLRLIMRQPGSTLALPRDGAEGIKEGEVIPWHFAAEVMDYARVMKGTETYMQEQYDCEISQLHQQEREDELMFGEETQWSKKAVSAVFEAKQKIVGLGDSPNVAQQVNERKSRRPATTLQDVHSEHHMTAAQVSESQLTSTYSGTSSSTSRSDGSTSHTSVSTGSIASVVSPSQSAVSESGAPSLPRYERTLATSHNHQINSPYYFYEALLHYYLSPLDIRILKAAFGEFASFPTTILPRVERISTGHIVDDDLRRRTRYLAHLPHGCEVGFLECDWTDVVPGEVLKEFLPEIERRRKRNWEKEVREEKERARAEKEEDDKRWAAARRRRTAPLEEVISEADFQPLPEPSAVDLAAASSSPPWSSSRPLAGSSFASLASPSTSPDAPRTIWGTRIAAPVSPALAPVTDEHEPSENDGWLQDWEKDLLQEEELVDQLEASMLETSNPKAGSGNVSGKKKKGKKITLMSTNARRGA